MSKAKKPCAVGLSMWAVVDNRQNIMQSAIENSRARAIVSWTDPFDDRLLSKWDYWRRRGYRVARVTVSEA